MNGRVWAMVVALLLAGCSHVDTVDDGLGHQARQARLATLENWSLRGQLVVDTGEERDRFRVNWEQTGDRLNLTISSIILGAGNVRLEGDGEELTITARGETRVLENPEEDLARELGLGWWLPVTSVRHWLLGMPDQRYPERSVLGAGGTLESLQQRDWQTTYDAYELVDGLLLPSSLKMRQGTLELSIEITRFTRTDSQA